MDLSKPNCLSATNEIVFGLRDDGNTLPAYIDSGDKKKWIATVINEHAKAITVTAIDNCIKVYRKNGELESTCDIMMNTGEGLYLVELKSKVSDWQSGGVEQLESTIILLKAHANEFYSSFKRRKAYVANRRHPRFHHAEIEDMERFRDVHKIRLYLEATIPID